MKSISTSEFTNWIDTEEDCVVVDVLPRNKHEKKHIPGARNVPLEGGRFPQRVEQLVGGDKRRKLVVYCSDEACDASPEAARQLEEDGFQNVFDLHEGLAGYEASGRPVATARAH